MTDNFSSHAPHMTEELIEDGASATRMLGRMLILLACIVIAAVLFWKLPW